MLYVGMFRLIQGPLMAHPHLRDPNVVHIHDSHAGILSVPRTTSPMVLILGSDGLGDLSVVTSSALEQR